MKKYIFCFCLILILVLFFYSQSEAEKANFKNIKIVQLVIKQTYEVTDKVNLPFYEKLEKILKCANYEVVNESAKKYDATIYVESKGVPEGKNYVVFEDGTKVDKFLWTKVSLQGTIYGIMNKKVLLKQDFFCIKECKDDSVIKNFKKYEVPHNYLFNEVFEQDFLPEFLKFIVNITEPSQFIYSLCNENKEIRETSLKVLDITQPNWRQNKDIIEKIIPKFIENLHSNNGDILEGCLFAFKNIGPIENSKLIENLINNLIDEEKSIREHSLEILNITSPDWKTKINQKHISKFINALKSNNLLLQRFIVGILSDIKKEFVIEQLISKTLLDENENVRNSTLEILNNIDKNWKENKILHKYIKKLPNILKNKDVQTKKFALNLLVEVKSEDSFEILVNNLLTTDRKFREEIEILLNKKDQNWVKSDVIKKKMNKFVNALNNENWNIREAAIEVLSKIDNYETIPIFISALNNDYSFVRKIAYESLVRITKENFGDDYKKWQKWWGKNKKRFIK